VTAAILRYPDAALVEDLDLFGQAVNHVPARACEPLQHVLHHLSTTPLLDLQRAYVETFDLKRRCCLYLSYFLNGDTRRRGAALWAFQEAIWSAGLQVEGGELPDFLPAVLELGAVADMNVATSLLQEHRGGLRLLRDALDELHSPYADALVALEAVLPPPRPGKIATALLLREQGPPQEMVGLDPPSLAPYDEPEPVSVSLLGSRGGSRR
jgi:nitrate reductase delta subunit